MYFWWNTMSPSICSLLDASSNGGNPNPTTDMRDKATFMMLRHAPQNSITSLELHQQKQLKSLLPDLLHHMSRNAPQRNLAGSHESSINRLVYRCRAEYEH